MHDFWYASGVDNQQERLAWLAGLFDGEGAFFIARKYPNSNHKNRPKFYPTIAMQMVDRETIERVDEICRENDIPTYISRGVRPSKSGHGTRQQETTRWAIVGLERCKRFLLALQPFLFTKRKHAGLLLEFIELRFLDERGDPLSDRQKQIIDEVKSLNHKGKNPQRPYAEVA